MKRLNLIATLIFTLFTTGALAADRNYVCTLVGTAPSMTKSYTDTMSLSFSGNEKFKIFGQSISGEEFDCHGKLTKRAGLTRSGLIDQIDSSTCSFFGGKSIMSANNLGDATTFISISFYDRRLVYKCIE